MDEVVEAEWQEFETERLVERWNFYSVLHLEVPEQTSEDAIHQEKFDVELQVSPEEDEDWEKYPSGREKIERGLGTKIVF